MRDHRVWSLYLGRWSGVQVYLHMFFLVFVAVILLLGWIATQNAEGEAGYFWVSMLSILILSTSVVLHELAHYAATTRLGGNVEQIVIGPFGGLAPPRVHFDPRAEIVAHAAGPIVNLIVCLVMLAVLFMLDSSKDGAWAVLNPLNPELFTGGRFDRTIGLRLGVWINWMLLLVNMIPMFPSDAGRTLCAVLTAFGNTNDDRHHLELVSRLGIVIKIVLLGAATAIFLGHDGGLTNPDVPVWFVMALGTIFLIFCARVEESNLEYDDMDDEFFGYDFSQGYTSLERTAHAPPPPPKAGFLAKWIERRRITRLKRRERREADEDRRMDEILARLHETGMDNLSSEERTILKRVSARYRSRERE